MNSCFNYIGMNIMKYELKRVEETARYSQFNGCHVAIFMCAKCKKWYEEEKEAAKEKIRRAEQMVCIGCDPDAEVVSVSVTRIKGILGAF